MVLFLFKSLSGKIYKKEGGWVDMDLHLSSNSSTILYLDIFVFSSICILIKRSQ